MTGEPLDAADRELGERLARERPLPSPAFRARVHAELSVAGSKERRRAPRPLMRAAVCASSGVVLLAIAAIGLAGAGPFAS